MGHIRFGEVSEWAARVAAFVRKVLTAFTLAFLAPPADPLIGSMPVTLRIIHGEVVRVVDWPRHLRRRQRRSVDEKGRAFLLRTIEFE